MSDDLQLLDYKPVLSDFREDSSEPLPSLSSQSLWPSLHHLAMKMEWSIHLRTTRISCWCHYNVKMLLAKMLKCEMVWKWFLYRRKKRCCSTLFQVNQPDGSARLTCHLKGAPRHAAKWHDDVNVAFWFWSLGMLSRQTHLWKADILPHFFKCHSIPSSAELSLIHCSSCIELVNFAKWTKLYDSTTQTIHPRWCISSTLSTRSDCWQCESA